ncbi:hypothetical protein ANTQUA_LOCUS10060 [Anthophora quadrimaculata]
MIHIMFFRTSSRGAQEVASCILMHMEDITTQKHVVAYSDACSSQNCNIKVALTWMKITQSSNNNIETKGHNFLKEKYIFGKTNVTAGFYFNEITRRVNDQKNHSKFHVLDRSPKRGRPKVYGNIKLLSLYTTSRPVTEEKHKDIMCLLSYISPVFQEHFKNLKIS